MAVLDVESGLSIGGVTLVILMTVIQLAPCKINPWDSLLKWIGNRLNADLRKEIKEVKSELNKHIEDSTKKDVRDSRIQILDFCNSCMNGRRHTKEEFEFIIMQCDDYEQYIEDNHIKNGVVSSAIKEIRRLYDICIQKNDFLKEGELI